MCNIDLTRDTVILFVARCVRLFSFGMISIVLTLYLTTIGFNQWQIGILFTTILFGNIFLTLILTTTADSIGRRNILIIGALLKIFAGIMFAFVHQYIFLIFAGIIGIISPTGGELGPFLAIEQACLTETVKDKVKIARIFGWYHFLGYVSIAIGALTAGYFLSLMTDIYQVSALNAHQTVFIVYAFFGLIKALMYFCLSDEVEVKSCENKKQLHGFNKTFGLHHPSSRRIVAKLSALFIIDSIAGGFIIQTTIVYWFHIRFQLNTDELGLMMMLTNIISGISGILATTLVAKFGAINTMVITHIPSNIFLLLIPFMPTKSLAILMLAVRSSMSQMDVPARQTFLTISVENNERSAAGGITNLVRSIGFSISPIIGGYLLKDSTNQILFSSPFIIAGGLKLIYDILLYLTFRSTIKCENQQDHHEEKLIK
ncbi:unnamed protein product [Adineta steineri]|uniref:Major facilitator superfamily (MFS) profile domain-containing protein n=1 Tax=Adineta steineri TaxID=433720 RepID=A0A819UZ70_9BILA|nr:unnamed protein product [Adineta steineri]CAF1281491.1 unnamed protein product [Adineta steineri]CAF4084041.1 unnamed protein product [Adineta steineri]CAF4089137.1 unnamed protein product [Adineta steineri]